MPAKQIAMTGREQRVSGARLRRFDQLDLLEPDAVEQGERRGDVLDALVDRVAARPEPDLAARRELALEQRLQLRDQPLLACTEPLAVTGERRMRHALLDGRGAPREQHQAGLVLV